MYYILVYYYYFTKLFKYKLKKKTFKLNKFIVKIMNDILIKICSKNSISKKHICY